MKNDHVIEMLPDYLDNLLEADTKKKIEEHLKACKTCTQELTEIKELFQAFKTEEKIIPPSSIKTGFLKQLEAEKQTFSRVVPFDAPSNNKRNKWALKLLKIAASVLLLIGAFLTGRYQSKENSSKEIALLTEEKLEFKQTAMLSLMENESASKRIQGVNFIDSFSNPDEAILKALMDRMLNDKNTNVRLTAVEALNNFTNSEIVKNAFIEALKKEKDPSIQINIIQTLVDIQEKKAIAPMQRLLEQEETQPFIKNQIESLLPSII